MSIAEARATGPVRSLVPARLDRLPWSRFHWLVVTGLGVSWILDGLEIQIVSQAGYQTTLGLSAGAVGAVGSVYLAGQVLGALVFGRITDRLGRRKLFMVTLALYLVASGIGGLSFSLWFLLIFRPAVAGRGRHLGLRPAELRRAAATAGHRTQATRCGTSVTNPASSVITGAILVIDGGYSVY